MPSSRPLLCVPAWRHGRAPMPRQSAAGCTLPSRSAMDASNPGPLMHREDGHIVVQRVELVEAQPEGRLVIVGDLDIVLTDNIASARPARRWHGDQADLGIASVDPPIGTSKGKQEAVAANSLRRLEGVLPTAQPAEIRIDIAVQEIVTVEEFDFDLGTA